MVGFLFPFEQPDSVVLLRKRTKGKDGVEFMDGLLNGLGGKVEPGEPGAAAMDRECREECGGLVANWEEVAVLTDGNFQLEVFRADCLLAQVPAENDVGERFRIVRIRDVVEQEHVRTIPNLQWMVPMAMGADRAFWPFSIIQSVLEDVEEGDHGG